MPHISPLLPPLKSKILSKESSILIYELLLEVGIFVLNFFEDTLIIIIFVIIFIIIILFLLINLSRLFLVSLTTRLLF